MSMKPPSPTVPSNLIELIEALDTITHLDRHRRDEMKSAVRVVSRRVFALPPSQILADPVELRARLARTTAIEVGRTERRWSNLKSLFNGALVATGVSSLGARSRDSKSPAWQEFLKRVDDRYLAYRISRFARYCTRRSIAPEEVTEDILAGFGKMLTEQSMVPQATQVYRETCVSWSRATDRFDDWAGHRVKVPMDQRVFTVPISTLPPSLRGEIDAYLRHLEGRELFDETAAAPASRETIRTCRVLISLLTTALVRSGRDPTSIVSLADIVEAPAAKQALTFLWCRDGQRKTGQLHNCARTIVKIAKHWVKVPPPQLEALRSLCRHVRPTRDGSMTERNRARLRVFDDRANRERLINLPAKIVKDACRLANPNYKAALRFQSALAIALLLVAPVRAKNLARLELQRHFTHSGPPGNRVVHLVIPAEEVKNKTPLEFELPADVVRLLDVYVDRFRPLLTLQHSDFLFPARKGGAKHQTQLATQIKRTIKNEAGFILNLHCFRHLAAYLFLKSYPGEYESVRLILGHKSLKTTVEHYCGLEQSDAMRRYDELIAQYRHGDPGDREHDG
jgi:hypothetical protein